MSVVPKRKFSNGWIMEKQLERKLVKAVAADGGWALKFTSSGTSGVPDRLLLFPEARIGFVEVKAPGKKPRQLQMAQMNKLKKLGFPVFVLDDADQIQKIIEEVKYGVHPS